MDELDVDYAPRSPDLSAIAAPPGDFSATPIDLLEDLHPQHQQYRGSVSHISIPLTPGGEHVLLRSPRGSTAGQPSLQQYQKAWEIHRQDSTSYGGYFQSPTTIMPARRGTAVMKDEFDGDEYLPQRGGRRAKAKEAVANGAAAAINPVNPQDVEVRTKFPVARIKRIMQADEDVGKVAQVTPVAVSKALELFMISLVTKAAAEAKTRSSKRVLASHLKNAVLKEPDKFDFLNDIVGKVADAPAAGAKNKREDESDESPNEGGPRKRRPAVAGTRSRRKKEGSEE